MMLLQQLNDTYVTDVAFWGRNKVYVNQAYQSMNNTETTVKLTATVQASSSYCYILPQQFRFHFLLSYKEKKTGDVEGAVIEKRDKKPKIEIPPSPDCSQC